MDWREQFAAHGEALGRVVYRDPVGVEFKDGCDVFWVLPGEVISTIEVPAEGPESIEKLIEDYQRIDSLRGRALHAIRHHLAESGIGVDRNRSGNWGIENSWSSNIEVGARLTLVARDGGDVYDLVQSCLKDSVVKMPAREVVEEYLKRPDPPARERAAQYDVPALKADIPQVLALMGLCKSLKNGEYEKPGKLDAAVKPQSRIAQALLAMAGRLGPVEASADLLKPGMLCVKFSDGNDWFCVDPRSRELAKKIRADGPQKAGLALAEEFEALNQARLRVLAAISRAAARRGWRKEEYGTPFMGIRRTVHLGQTHREVTFSVAEELTEVLRGSTPEGTVRKLFEGHPFAQECIATLGHANLTEVELPNGPLLPKDLPAAPPLRDLDEKSVAQMDDFAKQELARFLEEERTIWKYRDKNFYDLAIDRWARIADWVKVAERHLEGEWPHPMAIVILLDAQDPRGQELAEQYLAKAHPHHEVSSAEVEIVWRYRQRHPQIARQWFAPNEYEDVPFCEYRARLGDSVAQRRQKMERAHGIEGPVSRDELLNWARMDHHWSPPSADKLREAMEQGWMEVADALQENPYMLAGLLTRARRTDQFDEPGMLVAEQFLLIWSRMRPSRFLARLIATAHGIDFVKMAEEAAQEGVRRNPKAAKNLEMSIYTYGVWLKQMRTAMAIAWNRCRAGET